MAVEELQSIIMRCQILEEHNFNKEDFGLFQLAGQRCIEEGHIDQLLEIIQEERNKIIIKSMGWNLVGPVVRCLLKNEEEDKRKNYFLTLDILVKLCNPKELLLGLLELIEEPSGKQIAQIILLLLQPLQTVIQKLPNNKAYSVGLALSTLWSQLSLLPVPYSKEQIQADDYGLCQCCKALIEFMKPFVEEVTDDKENKENEKLKDELLKFCFKSLKCPLLTAQFLEQSEEVENDPLRCFASEIIGFLSAIGHPFPKIILNHGRKKRTWDFLEFEEEEDRQLADSMASLAYLVFVQGISIDQLPMVFSPSYLLQLNMGHIEVFLQRTEESAFSKGLELLENGLLRLEDNNLLYQYLEIKNFLTVPLELVKIMTLCPIETLRKKGLAMLQLYIDKLDSQGKYTLFRIMASLNLLRYLIIKDNENDNQTGLWTELGKIENNFLKPLHIGLNMSKAHYEAEIKNSLGNSQVAPMCKDVCSLTVSGQEIPNMPPEMQLKVLNSALFTFDLIESVLARVEELIEIKTKSTSEENVR
ncbi:glomulin [Nannospalax galili]|uniref:glomulin n=1 Tax=Nannospalax galili TaxID=1026970 RepID=UPI000819FB6F|nr:glomulin [Nannospalax galili]